MPMPHFRQTLVKHLSRIWSLFSGPRILYGWRNGAQAGEGMAGVHRVNTRYSTHSSFENPERLALGDHVFIGHFNRIDASCGLCIEEGVQLTNYISVLSHSSHRSVRIMGSTYTHHLQPLAYVRKATRIGAYSFIGPHSVIAPGANIGKGVIVQAYSFVTGEVPDFAVVASPALGQAAKVVGDTRQLDGKWLHQYPQTHASYAAWAGQAALEQALAQGHAEMPEAARPTPTPDLS